MANNANPLNHRINKPANQHKDGDVDVDEENEEEATGLWSNGDGGCKFTGPADFHNFWISSLLCLESM